MIKFFQCVPTKAVKTFPPTKSKWVAISTMLLHRRRAASAQNWQGTMAKDSFCMHYLVIRSFMDGRCLIQPIAFLYFIASGLTKQNSYHNTNYPNHR